MPNKLSVKKDEKIRAFCREYIKDFNATRAYKAVGGAEKSAHVEASKLLRNPKVQDYLAKLAKRREEKQLLEGDEILKKIQEAATADITEVLNEDGSFKPVSEWPARFRQAVNGFKVKTITNPFTGGTAGYVTEFKMSEKLKALELLGKNKKLFTDKIEHGGNVNQTVAIVDYEQMKELHKKFNEEF